MKILAVDSSGLTASAAVVEDDRVLAEFNVNNKKNHSVTLLPMIERLKKILELEMESIDAFAVSKGPGSFTGLRIGSATVKGLALALNKPIVEISTLEAMAFQLFGTDRLICPLLDARRNQVYAGLYRFLDENICEVLSDRAESIEEIIMRINEMREDVIFLGDGVPVNEEIIRQETKVAYSFAYAFQNRQRAAALGVLALRYAARGETVASQMHRPVYLRASQAERERIEKGLCIK